MKIHKPKTPLSSHSYRNNDISDQKIPRTIMPIPDEKEEFNLKGSYSIDQTTDHEDQAQLDFVKLDKNGDGRIDKNEVRSHLRSLGGKNMYNREAILKRFFDRYDTNGDGKIDNAEWLELY